MSRPVRIASFGASGYVASAANDAAVAALVRQGFTEEQARQTIANAKKSPEQAAREAAAAADAAKAYVETTSNRAAVEKLKSAGFTEEEAQKLIAAGRNPDDVISNLKSIATKKINQAAVDYLKKAYPDYKDLPLAEAQMLAATGGDPKKLLEILKDKNKRTSLFNAIDERLKKSGIDVRDRIAKGLGLSEGDQQTIGKAVEAAEGAYNIFVGISSASEAYSSSSFFAARWSEANMSDDSLANLARTLQDLADQSDADRARRKAAIEKGIRTATGGAAAIASAFGPIGMTIGALIVAGGELFTRLGGAEPGKDDNDAVYKSNAANYADKLWREWAVVPPSFNSAYYTLASYSDTVQQQVDWLVESDTENAWRADFSKVMLGALYASVVTDVPTPIVDLAAIGWFPFSFSDWAGGSNYARGNRFFPNSKLRVDKVAYGFSGDDLPEELLVGNDGYFISDLASDDFTTLAYGFAHVEVFNNKAATYEARNQSSPDNDAGWKEDFIDGNDVQYPYGYQLARNKWVQQLICDRIAATIGTLTAVAYGVAAEPVVEAAVQASRDAIKVLGWQPRQAARRLRQTFLNAAAVAKGQSPLKNAKPYLTNVTIRTDLPLIDKLDIVKRP